MDDCHCKQRREGHRRQAASVRTRHVAPRASAEAAAPLPHTRGTSGRASCARASPGTAGANLACASRTCPAAPSVPPRCTPSLFFPTSKSVPTFMYMYAPPPMGGGRCCLTSCPPSPLSLFSSSVSLSEREITCAHTHEHTLLSMALDCRAAWAFELLLHDHRMSKSLPCTL